LETIVEKNMTSLSLEEASMIVDEALAEGRRRGFAPLTVVVLDAGGQLKAAKREDGCSLLRPEIATGKAWGVLGMGFGGRELQRRARDAPLFFGALSDMSGGRVVPVPGGVLIRGVEGGVIAAVGVSGDTSDNDEICAVAGISAAQLRADTGAPAGGG
jgi:uncharacterized protein GlcG (DUF336 family)